MGNVGCKILELDPHYGLQVSTSHTLLHNLLFVCCNVILLTLLKCNTKSLEYLLKRYCLKMVGLMESFYLIFNFCLLPTSYFGMYGSDESDYTDKAGISRGPKPVIH